MKSVFIALLLVLSFYLLNDNGQIDRQLPSVNDVQLNLTDSVQADNRFASSFYLKNPTDRLPEQFAFSDRESEVNPVIPAGHSDDDSVDDNVTAYLRNRVDASNNPYLGFSDSDSGDFKEIEKEHDVISSFDLQALQNKLAKVSITNKNELFDALYMALDHVDADLRNENTDNQFSQQGSAYIEVLEVLSDENLANNDKELIINKQLNGIDHEASRDTLILLETVLISLQQNETNEVIITSQLDQIQLMIDSPDQPKLDLPGPNWDYEYQQYSNYTNSLAVDGKSLGTDPATYSMFFSDASDVQRMTSLQQVSLLVEKQMGYVH